MKFVNIQNRIISNSVIGKVNPGDTTNDNYKNLEKCLSEIIDICGKNFRVILNDRETQLIANLLELDEAGSKFDPSVIPLNVRRDPTGIKRLAETERKRQHESINTNVVANRESALREAIINGEVEEKPRIKPLGVNRTNEAAAEDDNKPLSGFEQILAENARIAAEHDLKNVVPENKPETVEGPAGDNQEQNTPSTATEVGQDAAEGTAGDNPEQTPSAGTEAGQEATEGDNISESKPKTRGRKKRNATNN